MEETLDQIAPILPVDFFQFRCELGQANLSEKLGKKHLLPKFSELSFEDPFASVYMGWNQKGLLFSFVVNQPFEECFSPDYRKGDSIELLIDTRDLKTSAIITRFCHHFVIYPKPMDGIFQLEQTAFRSEDRHELSEPNSINLNADFGKKSYTLDFTVPAGILHGFDPSSFDRIGFSYRINRVKAEPMHFAISSEYINLEQHPSLWVSMQMR